jgi:hypothetical protein
MEGGPGPQIFRPGYMAFGNILVNHFKALKNKGLILKVIIFAAQKTLDALGQITVGKAELK